MNWAQTPLQAPFGVSRTEPDLAMGVLGYDVLSPGDRIAIGGFGVGLQEGAGDDVWGGRVGAQWTWGRKPAPYVLK